MSRVTQPEIVRFNSVRKGGYAKTISFHIALQGISFYVTMKTTMMSYKVSQLLEWSDDHDDDNLV